MVTLDDIVKAYLSESGRNTTHEYLRLLGIANRGLKELTFDILGATKIALLELSDSLRIDLPSDYVDYTFIGMIGNDGKLDPLGMKTDIPLSGTQNTLAGSSTGGIYDASYLGYGGVFGNGGGQNKNGYYSPQIDWDNFQMIFTSAQAGKYIYIEYISDGRQEGGQTLIHPYAEAALIAYIHWKSNQYRRSVSVSEKESARRDFYNEKRLARARLQAFTKEEALQTIRKSFKQSPRM